MNNQNGFSLVEAMVTMAIAAVVLSIGVPSFQAYIQNNQKSTAVNDLATALQLARNSAVSRKVPVTLCKSVNGTNCVTANAAVDYSDGWMIFTNPDNIDGTAGLTGTEELLRVHGALPGNNSFIGNGIIVNRVTFNSKGLARGSNGTITHCDARGATSAKALVISTGGQVRQATDSDNNGIVDVIVSGSIVRDITC